MKVGIVEVRPDERTAFLHMAQAHFRELDPEFVPQENWQRNYFENIQSKPRFDLRWIVADDRKVGFVLFGLENHRFLPKTSGWIYELYVLPEHRRRGIARISAEQVIQELGKHCSRFNLEIMDGNHAALRLWESMGFNKFCERWVRNEEPKR